MSPSFAVGAAVWADSRSGSRPGRGPLSGLRPFCMMRRMSKRPYRISELEMRVCY
jgi:hypothetical protein